MTEKVDKMADFERRCGNSANIELRKAENGNGVKVSGYAAVFGEETTIGNYYREVIDKGAFDGAIGRDDVVFNINHEGLPLARTSSKTLTLKEDDHGLYMATELNGDDPDVQTIVPKMERGDLSKMSFAFVPTVQEWEERDGDELPLRRIKEAQLFDVSIVTTPAYEGTEIGLRSLEAFKAGESEKNKHATDNLRRSMKMKLALSR